MFKIKYDTWKEKIQYELNREAAKISALSFCDIDTCE